MKRLRLGVWSGQLLSARPGAATSCTTATATATPSRLNPRLSLSTSCPCLQRQVITSRHEKLVSSSFRRYQSTAPPARDIDADADTTAPAPAPAASAVETASSAPSSDQQQQNPPSTTTSSHTEPPQWPTIDVELDMGPLPSPLPNKALRSAKLAAMHARLALSDKIPLQTLARTLVDVSADSAPLFSNVNLAFLGSTLISYHVSEMLMCRYPRLPMEIMYESMRAYAGDHTLYQVARSWGVESAAAPGAEVDPGLLQFSFTKPRAIHTKWGFARSELQRTRKYRRGISSRVVMDDDFGDVITPMLADELHGADGKGPEDELKEEDREDEDEEGHSGLSEERQLALGDPDEKVAKSHNIHGQFVRAVVGAIYTHAGREAAKSFIKSHILSRQLDLAKLFTFKLPIRELARLCMREEFDPPVARLLSETGRLSRTPVFVVGIFSGNDKLGEGAASSLNFARKKAAMHALKAWYLYSPGDDVPVPSDMLSKGAKPWEPVYVDMGEVITPGL